MATKCNHTSCSCNTYIENTTISGKGKCASCNHSHANHTQKRTPNTKFIAKRKLPSKLLPKLPTKPLPTLPTTNLSTLTSQEHNYNDNTFPSTESKQNIDLKIFKSPMRCSINSDVVSECLYLQRLLKGLECYQLLIVDTPSNESKTYQEPLVHFCTQTYTNVLDDFIHCIQNHSGSDHLMQITDGLLGKFNFKSCDITKCNKLRRHYRRKIKENIASNSASYDADNGKFILYSDCFDRWHHHIFHLFEMGLRVKPMEIVNNSDRDNSNVQFSCVDKLFEKRRDLIEKRKKACALDLERYNDQFNKYNIQVNIQNNTHNKPEHTMENNTFLDQMYEFITENGNITQNQTKKLNDYIMLNEYDSDAVKEDLHHEENILLSNIHNIIKNVVCIDLMKEYIRCVQLSSISFSTGYIFYYWNYHKSMSESVQKLWDHNKKYILHNGHSINNLLISPTYTSLKEEILTSGFVNMNEWNENILLKANEYHQTKKGRTVKCKAYENKHGIKFESPILLSHLICVILYCDWSDLCTEFSASFRKKYEFEPLELLKARHSKYYHFSKLLVEAVVDFGIDGQDEKGPLYCGLSLVLEMSSFAMYLKGPCSTTKNIEVAINFAKRDGIIMELQNDQLWEGAKQRFFDCSWLSNYSEENERLFIAGDKRLRIQSIRIVDTSKNFQSFFHALYLFDHMISGINGRNIGNITSSDVKILNALINNKLMPHKTTVKVDEYIVDTFDLFLNKKTQIEISMVDLDKYFNQLNYLIMESVDSDLFCQMADNKWSQKTNRHFIHMHYNSNDSLNLLNTKILSIFPNLRQIVIHTTCTLNRVYTEYRFSLASFLSSITSAKSSIKYIIKANIEDMDIRTVLIKYIHTTWLNNIVTPSIKQMFNNKKWNIRQLRKTNSKEWVYEDCLIINQKSLKIDAKDHGFIDEKTRKTTYSLVHSYIE